MRTGRGFASRGVHRRPEHDITAPRRLPLAATLSPPDSAVRSLRPQPLGPRIEGNIQPSKKSPMRRAAILALAIAPAAAAAPVFGPGEQMTFAVTYFTIPAGTVQATVGAPTRVRGQTVWPVVIFARTESVFSIYPVKDKFVSYFEPKLGRSIGSDFFADEGGRRRRLTVELDHAAAKGRIVRWFEDAEGTDEVWDVASGSFDMAAAAFALRNFPLAVGDEVELPVFTGHHAFTLVANAEAEEKVTVPAGTFDCRRILLKVSFLRKLETTQPMVAWMTADERHVPVRIQGSFVLGTLTADLVVYHRGLNPASFGVR